MEVNGGHISTLFKRGETIVPAIASTFEKVASTLAARGGRGGERESDDAGAGRPRAGGGAGV